MGLLKLLFIGNSHTYCNDLPQRVRRMAESEGFSCHVTMLAHGGWTLGQHAEEPEAKFNILYGGYDFVILQEHAHPFPPEDKYLSAVLRFDGWIRQAGSQTVIFSVWSKKSEPERQTELDRIQRSAAGETGAVLAPVGENWHMRSDAGLYGEDGAHASETGSEFAAKIIWESISAEIKKRQSTGSEACGTAAI